MSIKFHYVELQNVMSYGLTKTRISLDRSPSTLIVGDNGTGKSTIYEAIHIALFGTSIRDVKKAKIVNYRNKKGAYAAVSLTANGDRYLIERGIKPDFLRIEKNGAMMDEHASVKAMQAIINRDILKCDKTGFQITTLISKSGIDMFMGLKNEERKKFIDHMLDTAVFTDMAKLNNANLSTANAALDALKNDVLRLELSLEGKTELLKERVENAKENYRVAVERYDREREGAEFEVAECKHLIENRSELDTSSLEDDLKATSKTLKGLQSRFIESADTEALDKAKSVLEADLEEFGPGRLEEIREIRREFIGKHAKNAAQLEILTETLDKTVSGFCAACGQEVNSEHVEKERARLEKEIASLTGKNRMFSEFAAEIDEEESDILGILDKIKNVDLEIREANDELRKSQQGLTGQIGELQHRVAMLKSDIKLAEIAHEKEGDRLLSNLATLIKKRDTLVAPVRPDFDALSSEIEAEIGKLKGSIVEKTSGIEKESENVLQLKVIADILKGGAKLAVIDTFIPIINRVANDKLLELGFNARFELQADFSDSIYYNGMEPVEFAQLSEGEKLRINIAMLLTWREIAKMQGKIDSNLLMFDEKLDGSLDHDGYEALADIFERLGVLNIFVISHNSPKMENFIRSKITVERDDGYSTIK